MIRVTAWNEFRHEKTDAKVKAVYPTGIHQCLADFLNRQDGIKARIASLDDPEHGLTDAVLDETDVLTWWGHAAHHEVRDEIVNKVAQRVHEGMGLICLHSAHVSKIFRKLTGSTGSLCWREANEKERLWIIEPSHPIAQGLPARFFEIEHDEMYGERFDIPTPDKLVFITWFPGGEVFRSGCCFERGHGRIFYFQPGHETFPVYYDRNVQTVIANAVRWAAPRGRHKLECPMVKELEPLPGR